MPKPRPAAERVPFASSIPSKLSRHTDLASPTLATELRSRIESSHHSTTALLTNKHEEIDDHGIELFNLATRLRHQLDADPSIVLSDSADNSSTSDTHQPVALATQEPDVKVRAARLTLLLLRAFSFLRLLDPGHTLAVFAGAATRDYKVRIWRAGLKAAKTALEAGEVDIARRVLERLAEYVKQDEDEVTLVSAVATGRDARADRSEVEKKVRSDLKTEYVVLRIVLAWKQDCIDVAEYHFHQISPRVEELDPIVSRSLADALFEIGRDLMRRGKNEHAVKWLGRASDLLSEQDLGRLNPDSVELFVSVAQAHVKAMLSVGTDDMKKGASEVVDYLEVNLGGQMIVALLRLDVIATTKPFDADRYYEVLLSLTQSIVLTEANFTTIMYHIRKIQGHRPELACQALDDLMTMRLFTAGKDAWVEKVCVTRIWITISLPESSASTENLLEVMDTIREGTKKPLAALATHAAQTLLWKRIDSAYAREDYAVADAWCQRASHPLFEMCGELNQSKLARKRLLCAVGRRDYVFARGIFYQMTDEAKANPLTRYLVYKTAIRSGDFKLAAECLDVVCRKSNDDATLLYACVLEAQQTGDRAQAVAALHKVLDIYSHGAPPGVALATLFRCTAKLLITSLASANIPDEAVTAELCRVFEAASMHAQNPRRSEGSQAGHFSAVELEWFSKNSYNTALKHCVSMHPQHVVRLAGACVQFIELKQSASKTDEGLSLRRLYCEILAAAASVTLARSLDSMDASLQSYIAVRKHAQTYREKLPEQLQHESLTVHAKEDLIAKYFELLTFELESVLKLQDWSAMDALFEACWTYESPKAWDRMADLALVFHDEVVKADLDRTYQATVLAALQKIINSTWRVGTKDVVRLGRWIRCLYQMSFSFDETISLHCLEQATGIAQKRKGTPVCFPDEELHWLATTSFNRAVDFYCAGDDARCRLWAEKALALAAMAEDELVLHKAMMGRYSGLSWER